MKALQKLGLICEKLMELDASEYYYKDATTRQNRVVTPSQKLQVDIPLQQVVVMMNNLTVNVIEPPPPTLSKKIWKDHIV